MAYQATLHNNLSLTIVNYGEQTQITSTSNSPGQQQSQSNSFSTGQWQNAPQLWQIDRGYILQINGTKGQYSISIQAQNMQIINGIPTVENAIPVKLETIPDPVNQTSQTSFNFEPMQPMQPLKMGNMSMDLNSMSMQMGNMSLNMTNRAKKTNTKVFCSQCGTEAKSGDRFCRSCGHNLSN